MTLPTGEYRQQRQAEAEDAGLCWVCWHPEHGVEDCCAALVRSGEGERVCGCIEGVDG